jgi:hypothetical protein
MVTSWTLYLRVIDWGSYQTGRRPLTWPKSKSPKLDGMHSKIKSCNIYNYVHLVYCCIFEMCLGPGDGIHSGPEVRQRSGLLLSCSKYCSNVIYYAIITVQGQGFIRCDNVCPIYFSFG